MGDLGKPQFDGDPFVPPDPFQRLRAGLRGPNSYTTPVDVNAGSPETQSNGS
jgi:hypothetical protein